MALGWAVMLALLGLWSGTVNTPTDMAGSAGSVRELPRQLPVLETTGGMVLQSGSISESIEQALILGQSV